MIQQLDSDSQVAHKKKKKLGQTYPVSFHGLFSVAITECYTLDNL